MQLNIRTSNPLKITFQLVCIYSTSKFANDAKQTMNIVIPINALVKNFLLMQIFSLA